MKMLYETIRTLVRGGVDLTPRQIHILFTLDTPPGRNGISLGALADLATLPRPLVSRSMERLIAGAYVSRTRDEKDHRLVLATLTAEGIGFLNAMHDGGVMRTFVARLASDIADFTLRQLFTVSACVQEPRTIRWLAQDMNVVKPAITRAVDRLEQEDYVERCEDSNDRRSVLVTARPKGRAFVKTTMTTV